MQIILSFLIILFLLPLYFLIFLFYTAQNINPLFKCKRIGLNAKIFCQIKFKTIKDNKNISYLTTEDMNIFYYFSNFFRKYKIDELPQFFNILQGQMSFVGPRPIPQELFSKYSKEDAKIIFSVKPGLTDFATLIYGISPHGNKNILNEEEYFNTIEKKKIYLRKIYIKNKSFYLDIQIIFFTIISLLGFVKITESNLFKYFKLNNNQK